MQLRGRPDIQPDEPRVIMDLPRFDLLHPILSYVQKFQIAAIKQ